MATVAALLLVGTALAVLGLVVVALVAAARGRRIRARRAAFAAVLLVTLYAVALLGVGATATPGTLATGEWKCFDEWCVSLTSADRSGDVVTVDLAVQNRGRRQQAPDSPRVWLVRNGVRDAVVAPGLNGPVAGGTSRALPPLRLTTPAAQRALLSVTEGGFPSVLVIGDDSSPFHPRPAWPLP